MWGVETSVTDLTELLIAKNSNAFSDVCYFLKLEAFPATKTMKLR